MSNHRRSGSDRIRPSGDSYQRPQEPSYEELQDEPSSYQPRRRRSARNRDLYEEIAENAAPRETIDPYEDSDAYAEEAAPRRRVVEPVRQASPEPRATRRARASAAQADEAMDPPRCRAAYVDPEEEPQRPARRGRVVRDPYEDEGDIYEDEPPRRASRSERSAGRNGALSARQVPAREEERTRGAAPARKAAGRKANARYDEDYDDEDYDDDYDDEDYDDEDEGRRSHKGLWIALSILLALIIAVVVLMFLRPPFFDQFLDQAGGWVQKLIGGEDEEARLAALHIESFTVDTQQAQVGDTLHFELITSNTVHRVRLQNGMEEVLAEAPTPTDGATVFADGDLLYWTIPYTFDAPYSGVIDALAGTDTAWASTGYATLSLQVSEEIVPTETPALLETAAPTVEAAPTEAPVATTVPDETVAPTATPVPFVVSAASPAEAAKPEVLGLTHTIIENGAQVPQLVRPAEVSMGSPDEYALQNGVLTFRSGPLRANASFGTLNVAEKRLEIIWSNRTGALDDYAGISWTGQPLIVKWHKEIRERMNIVSEKKASEGLKEVIFAAMDGNIYFYDLDDGLPTRDPIVVGYPFKGTPAVHTQGYPLLFAGQGISKLKSGTGTIGMRIFNLIDQKAIYLESGRNSLAPMQNGAVDGSPLIARKSDTLIYGGENGLFYTISLGARFDTSAAGADAITIDPKTVAYAYTVPKKTDVSLESSVAVYGNYAYFADGSGTLQCVDMNTMTPVWAADVTDHTDATVALEIGSDGSVALYTGCMVLNQGSGGSAYIRRYNALTGEKIWEQAVKCKLDKDAPGGVVASPVIGQYDISDLVIFPLSQTDNGGDLYAFDKETGEVIWKEALDSTTWSSPVAVYQTDGTSFLIQGDDSGLLRLLDGFSGSVQGTVQLEGAIIGSPAAYENIVVVGTTSRMYGIRIQ